MSLCSLSLLLALAAPDPARAEVVMLKAARLVDGRSSSPLSPAMVRIEGDRIAAVDSRLPVPPGARVDRPGRRDAPARASSTCTPTSPTATACTGRKRS